MIRATDAKEVGVGRTLLKKRSATRTRLLCRSQRKKPTPESNLDTGREVAQTPEEYLPALHGVIDS